MAVWMRATLVEAELAGVVLGVEWYEEEDASSPVFTERITFPLLDDTALDAGRIKDRLQQRARQVDAAVTRLKAIREAHAGAVVMVKMP